VQEVTLLGLLTIRTLTQSCQRKGNIEQAKRLAGERKVSQREGPQRQVSSDSDRIPGSNLEPGLPAALS
jgi:hypothetical protein